MEIVIRQVKKDDIKYAILLSQMYTQSAVARKTGIAQRSPEYLIKKIEAQDAIVAVHKDELVGFCYIETFTSQSYVSNSGLIVHPDYRGQGLAKKIKKKVINLARVKYPKAKVFGITTSPAVMNININLGYKPVPFSDLTSDDQFWNGCKTCVNFDVLTRNEKQMCLCTGMLAPSADEMKKNKPVQFIKETVVKLFNKRIKMLFV